MLITANKSTTFFDSRIAAIALAAKGEMNEDDGFFVIPAPGRPGKFIIEVRDEDGFVLGNI